MRACGEATRLEAQSASGPCRLARQTAQTSGADRHADSPSSDGYRETSVVTFGDRTIIFDVTGPPATGETVRVRCTWTLPKDEYEGKCETLTDGEWWHSGTKKGVRVK